MRFPLFTLGRVLLLLVVELVRPPLTLPLEFVRPLEEERKEEPDADEEVRLPLDPRSEVAFGRLLAVPFADERRPTAVRDPT